MKRAILTSALALGALGLVAAHAAGSGSIGFGAGKVGPRAAYSQGKALTYRELACDGCPLGQGELNDDSAMRLADSLEAAYYDLAAGADADVVQALCGDGLEDCKARIEMVHYFLSRRFGPVWIKNTRGGP